MNSDYAGPEYHWTPADIRRRRPYWPAFPEPKAPRWARPERPRQYVIGYGYAGKPILSTHLPTFAERMAQLTRPSEDRFPYTLKPKGWSVRSDPFTAEARRRLSS